MIEQKIIDHIIPEFRRIQGELVLMNTMIRTREPIDDKNIKDIVDIFKLMAKEKQENEDLLRISEYNRGKYDAYADIMTLIGFPMEKLL